MPKDALYRWTLYLVLAAFGALVMWNAMDIG
jgi:hypothetical protein